MSLTLTLATALKKTVKNSYHVVLVDDNSQTMGQLTSELQTAVSRLIEASRFKGSLPTPPSVMALTTIRVCYWLAWAVKTN